MAKSFSTPKNPNRSKVRSLLTILENDDILSLTPADTAALLQNPPVISKDTDAIKIDVEEAVELLCENLNDVDLVTRLVAAEIPYENVFLIRRELTNKILELVQQNKLQDLKFFTTLTRNISESIIEMGLKARNPVFCKYFLDHANALSQIFDINFFSEFVKLLDEALSQGNESEVQFLNNVLQSSVKLWVIQNRESKYPAAAAFLRAQLKLKPPSILDPIPLSLTDQGQLLVNGPILPILLLKFLQLSQVVSFPEAKLKTLMEHFDQCQYTFGAVNNRVLSTDMACASLWKLMWGNYATMQLMLSRDFDNGQNAELDYFEEAYRQKILFYIETDRASNVSHLLKLMKGKSLERFKGKNGERFIFKVLEAERINYDMVIKLTQFREVFYTDEFHPGIFDVAIARHDAELARILLTYMCEDFIGYYSLAIEKHLKTIENPNPSEEQINKNKQMADFLLRAIPETNFLSFKTHFLNHANPAAHIWFNDLYYADLARSPTPMHNVITTPASHMIIGDLHANILNILYPLLHRKFIETTKYDDIAHFYYTKAPGELSKADIIEFVDLLKTISFKAGNLTLMGDDLCDRGQNDAYTLLLYPFLNNSSIEYEILLSNHTLEFMIDYDSGKPTYRSDILTDDEKDSNPKNFALSMTNLGKSVSSGALGDDKIAHIMDNDYAPHLKLISYIYNDQTNTLKQLTHAPNGYNVVEELCEILNIVYKESNTAQERMKLIDEINETFQHQRNLMRAQVKANPNHGREIAKDFYQKFKPFVWRRFASHSHEMDFRSRSGKFYCEYGNAHDNEGRVIHPHQSNYDHTLGKGLLSPRAGYMPITVTNHLNACAKKNIPVQDSQLFALNAVAMLMSTQLNSEVSTPVMLNPAEPMFTWDNVDLSAFSSAASAAPALPQSNDSTLLNTSIPMYRSASAGEFRASSSDLFKPFKELNLDGLNARADLKSPKK